MSRRRSRHAARVAHRRPIRERTRPVPALLVDGELIVPRCPFCGREHVHGGAREQIGALTSRVAHCPGDVEDEPRVYTLRVTGPTGATATRRGVVEPAR
jgi:hypothetical protein